MREADKAISAECIPGRCSVRFSPSLSLSLSSLPYFLARTSQKHAHTRHARQSTIIHANFKTPRHRAAVTAFFPLSACYFNVRTTSLGTRLTIDSNLTRQTRRLHKKFSLSISEEFLYLFLLILRKFWK